MTPVGETTGPGAAPVATAIVYPPLHVVIVTAALPGKDLEWIAPMPFLVRGADKLRRAVVRRRLR